jgi:hypothetical protein
MRVHYVLNHEGTPASKLADVELLVLKMMFCVRRQKEWQLSGPELRYGFAPSGPCG